MTTTPPLLLPPDELAQYWTMEQVEAFTVTMSRSTLGKMMRYDVAKQRLRWRLAKLFRGL